MNGRKNVISFLYKRDWQKLYFHAYNLIDNEESAKDIVSDVFCTILENEDITINDIDNILPLLFTMVRNKCIDFLRHKKVIEKNEKIYIEELFSNWTKQDYIKYERKIEDLQNSINAMAPQMRLVVEEFFLNNKKCSEISEQLNISDNTVRTHITRAIKILRKRFLCFF